MKVSHGLAAMAILGSLTMAAGRSAFGSSSPSAADLPKAAAGAWRDTFSVNKAKLADAGTNPYFIPLVPGNRLTYAGKDGETTLVVSVLDETRVVDGVKTRVIEERETARGQPTEVSRNFYAIDKVTGDVYYFGEEVDIYKDSKVTGHEGAWQSGAGGARFGLMMPGKPEVGNRYYQERGPKAQDRAEIVSVTDTVKTPLGTFTGCVHTKDSSAIEPGSGDKWFAPGVGMLQDDEFVLSKIEKPATSAK